MQVFVNKVNKNIVTKIEIEKDIGEGVKNNQKQRIDFDHINANWRVGGREEDDEANLIHNKKLTENIHKNNANKKILNEQQLDQQVENHQRLTESKLNKMSDKLSMKKHKIHELTCLYKSMIKLTANKETNPNSTYNIKKGIDI